MVKHYIGEGDVLLLLDNFEQVIDAASLVVDLLASCRRLKVLVTSRARLNVRGEYEALIPTLSVPELKHPDIATLTRYAAVELFIQRAVSARSDLSTKVLPKCWASSFPTVVFPAPIMPTRNRLPD